MGEKLVAVTADDLLIELGNADRRRHTATQRFQDLPTKSRNARSPRHQAMCEANEEFRAAYRAVIEHSWLLAFGEEMKGGA